MENPRTMTINEAIKAGYTHATNDLNDTYPLKSMDGIDTIEYNYVDTGIGGPIIELAF